MHVEDVVRLPLGGSNAYLIITDHGALLVDAGMPGYHVRVVDALARHDLTLKDLQLIIITHAHYDHVGGAAELRRRSGAALIIQEQEAEILRSGSSDMPAGATPLGKMAVSMSALLGKTKGAFEPLEPDMTFAEELDLVTYGFPGKLFHTPGHSLGSACLVGEENGYSFVGDTLFGILPRKLDPPFADRPEQLLKSWRLLLEHGAQHFYPGHGRPFGRDRLVRAIWRFERT